MEGAHGLQVQISHVMRVARSQIRAKSSLAATPLCSVQHKGGR